MNADPSHPRIREGAGSAWVWSLDLGKEQIRASQIEEGKREGDGRASARWRLRLTEPHSQAPQLNLPFTQPFTAHGSTDDPRATQGGRGPPKRGDLYGRSIRFTLKTLNPHSGTKKIARWPPPAGTRATPARTRAAEQAAHKSRRSRRASTRRKKPSDPTYPSDRDHT